MATFTSLPIDIVQIIIHSIVNCVGLNIYTRKIILPLLAVCRAWRSVAIPLFYNYAYFWDFSACTSSLRFYFAARSNIDIILKNGYSGHVCQFMYLSQKKIYAVDSLLHIARTLNINSENCPDIDSLMDYHGSKSNIPMDWGNEKHIAAITTIATKFAYTFPNIRQLNVNVENAHGIILCFLLVLADCFAGQLVEFNYSGSLRFPIKHTIAGLQTIHLHLTGGNREWMYPAISPQSIQKLTLYADNSMFDWRIFSTEQNPDDIVLDQLEYLFCKGFNIDNNTDYLDSAYRLQFPNIKKATFHHFRISTDNVNRLVRSGLRELHYIARLSDLLELSRLDFSGLASLEVKFEAASSAIQEFVSSTNTLFCRLKNIANIKCTIQYSICDANLDGIYWPNVTQLVVSVSTTIGYILQAALKMPDLVYLKVYVNSYSQYSHQELVDDALAYFEGLRNNHEPSSSKIEFLQLNYKREVPDQFRSAIQVLKWYWPNLCTINVRQ